MEGASPDRRGDRGRPGRLAPRPALLIPHNPLLAPAYLPKEGTGHDLALAVAMLAASRFVQWIEPNQSTHVDTRDDDTQQAGQRRRRG